MTRRVTREGYDVDLVGKLELHDPLAHFKRHGFTYVPDLINHDLCDAVRIHYDYDVEDKLNGSMIRYNSRPSENTFYKFVLAQLHESSKIHEWVTNLTKFENHSYFGVNVLRYLKSGFPAHQDKPNSTPSIVAWVACEDIPQETALLWVTYGCNSEKSIKQYISSEELMRSNLTKKRIVPTMKKGDVLFMDGTVIHGSTNPLDKTKTRFSAAIGYNLS